jgi:hypothetical protein
MEEYSRSYSATNSISAGVYRRASAEGLDQGDLEEEVTRKNYRYLLRTASGKRLQYTSTCIIKRGVRGYSIDAHFCIGRAREALKIVAFSRHVYSPGRPSGRH